MPDRVRDRFLGKPVERLALDAIELDGGRGTRAERLIVRGWGFRSLAPGPRGARRSVGGRNHSAERNDDRLDGGDLAYGARVVGGRATTAHAVREDAPA